MIDDEYGMIVVRIHIQESFLSLMMELYLDVHVYHPKNFDEILPMSPNADFVNDDVHHVNDARIDVVTTYMFYELNSNVNV
jgi:hypothetical protein